MKLGIFVSVLIAMNGISSIGTVGEEVENFERFRENHVEFSYIPSSSINSVEISGEWDNWEKHNLTFENGEYSIHLSLEPGYFCYKFIIDQTEWVFDPVNTYKKYCNSILNSGIIVDNFNNPKLEIDYLSQELFNLRVKYFGGYGGTRPDNFEISLVHNFESTNVTYVWDEEDWTIHVNLDFDNGKYELGKYTLSLVVTDSNGKISQELYIPFWFEEEKFNWNGALIYMIMTDRFANGNYSNDPIALPDVSGGADWQGGDFEGVISLLESGYFKEMGVSAIWFTPFNSAVNGSYLAADNNHQVSGYHGYWPVKSREIDSRLGTAEELKELVVLAHGQGIRILNDFVINHVHEEHEYFLENPEWFREGCILGTLDCDWTEHALDGVFTSYMPDVDWENPEASEKITEDAIWWQKEFDLDGSRIDAVKHVESLAISNLVSKFDLYLENDLTDYYLLGETAMGWNGDNLEDNIEEYEKINTYLGEGGLDGQGDFVLYHSVVDNVFRYEVKDFQHLDYWTEQSQNNYVEGSIMTPYLGSHDTSRLISRLDDSENNSDNKWVEDELPQQPIGVESYQKAKLAFSWLLTIPGAPIIYMGDEYGEFGGSDPDNRHTFRSGNQLSNYEKDLLSFVTNVSKIRKNSQDLREGYYRSIYSDSTLICFARVSENSETIVIINSGTEQREIELNVGLEASYSDYYDLINNKNVTEESGELIFNSEANNISIFSSYNNETGDINQTEIGNQDNETIDEGLNDVVGKDNESTELNQTIPDEEETQSQSNSSDKSDGGNGLPTFRFILFLTLLILISTFYYTRGFS